MEKLFTLAETGPHMRYAPAEPWGGIVTHLDVQVGEVPAAAPHRRSRVTAAEARAKGCRVPDHVPAGARLELRGYNYVREGEDIVRRPADPRWAWSEEALPPTGPPAGCIQPL